MVTQGVCAGTTECAEGLNRCGARIQSRAPRAAVHYDVCVLTAGQHPPDFTRFRARLWPALPRLLLLRAARTIVAFIVGVYAPTRRDDARDWALGFTGLSLPPNNCPFFTIPIPHQTVYSGSTWLTMIIIKRLCSLTFELQYRLHV